MRSCDDTTQSGASGHSPGTLQSGPRWAAQSEGATQIYDQLAQGTAQQLDQGVQQLFAKIGPTATAEDIATHAKQAEREGQGGVFRG